MPGPLQTEDYARTLIKEGSTRADAEEIERMVRTRTGRLPSLLREGKVELISFVIRESVFTDVVGDAKIMKKQLEHIARLAEEDAAQVQVLPASVRTGIKAYLPFQVLTLGIAQLVAVVEHHEGGMVIDEPEVVRRMATQFGRLQAEALSPSESLKLMCKIMEDRYGDVAQVQL